MREPGYSEALRVLRGATGSDLQGVLIAACEPIPAWDPVVYLGDFSGNTLLPLAGEADKEDVGGSMAGRAFTTGQPVAAAQGDAVRVWVPVTEQASRTGVLAVTVPHATPGFLEQTSPATRSTTRWATTSWTSRLSTGWATVSPRRC
jgi:hypothetical protein